MSTRARLAFEAALLAALLAACGGGDAPGAAPRPNILLVVADDLGWADVGWHGSTLATPNLDRLARGGVELDRHYVSPVCSPTRAALLSGRYASRFGVTGPQAAPAFPEDTVTLAHALHRAGYATAITGKWHLGSKPEWGPQRHGFEHAYGSLGGGVGPWTHRYRRGEFSETWHRNGELVREDGHVTDLIAAEAVRWIERDDPRPLFLYLAFTAPHVPIDEPQRWLDVYPSVEPVTRRQYAASVSHMDDAVGLVVAALERSGRLANTLIVFTSDNGANPGARNANPDYPGSYAPGPAGGSNRPLRGAKRHLYEGGIRVPAFAYWDGVLAPGKLGAPVHAVDWMPTLCALAGCDPARDLRWDGRNVWPWLTGESAPEPRPLYFASSGYRSRAVREGDWKLIVFRDPTRSELFDLEGDPYEERDLAAQEPARVAALQALLRAMAEGDLERPARALPARDR